MSSRFNRKKSTLKEKKKIVILTEGTETEPNYFTSKSKEIEESIRRKGIKIEIKGKAFNTLSLVDYAISYIEKEGIDLSIDDCWVVFDKDSFDKAGGRNRFDDAINKAKANNIKVAYSNESFELWFLLHFIPLDVAISRKEYNSKLTEHLKKITSNKVEKYCKEMNIYSLICNKESSAIRNAKRLINQYMGNVSFSSKNPSTTVHLLIEALNKFK
ncbi:MAG: RloB family protein [Candidatus Pacebacteria bacterium]|nr:RloB family protein [Candidatus Paceibacterota bacterium]